ncbi:MAG TPA: glucose-6-phosphate dehydrogenase (NADP(+)) [Pseudonocardia sp.]|jgi:glucose-6-phosphate 1-dehydrogenase|uniref:glucose-6-phosphate dehydrogenase n=1 Tax=Pseudonocardia sp. TaxID=60912 RepID=UPI002CDA4062|nr:glucose-6-phosphate dehydrogenase (NADP(+)) [Pseudonocardia sp.]HTF47807.1 glucose-6-phosphate dehydrogenase (NADP(+)) [Pseudonocardia sp.]
MSEPQQVLAPTVFVLFGATGDLARRMVLPAFYRLAIENLLPPDWRLIGNGRGEVSHEDFQGRVHAALAEFGPHPEDGPWEEFRSRLLFAGGGFEPDDPGHLVEVIKQVENELGGEPQRVHYLAVPPTAFATLTSALGEHGLAERSRVVYEKPFGVSLESFRALNDAVHRVLDESQVFRIDHFLGKEATQDLHIIRFANGLFSGVWDAQHVAEVQIDVPETLDVADRASFYDGTGAVLDMLVTHLFQVAAEVAMEPPATLTAEDLAVAREAVIGAFRPMRREDVVLGQFEGYRDIEGVPADSCTETFVAARLWVDTDRWRGVPFLLRTGKQLAQSRQVVSLVFREPEAALHDLPEMGNVLTFDLAGNGGLGLALVVKQPGPTLDLRTGHADLSLASVDGADPLPPYVRLIHDVLLGDRSLFTRPDGLEHVWTVAGEFVADRPEPLPYPRGSWGPEAAEQLAGPAGWLLSRPNHQQS